MGRREDNTNHEETEKNKKVLLKKWINSYFSSEHDSKGDILSRKFTGQIRGLFSAWMP